MSWRFIVPLKSAAARKSRLAGLLDPAERARLTERWFASVTEVLAPLGDVIVLSDTRPDIWLGAWIEDRGRGLNPELDDVYERLRPVRLAIVHADLPLLATEDVDALLDAAEREGCAVAADRHDSGTNAIAIADGRPFRFGFGERSLARHAGTGVAIVRRPSLAHDIDAPDDLRLLADRQAKQSKLSGKRTKAVTAGSAAGVRGWNA